MAGPTSSNSSQAPRYFIVSGFPKCGNKWLQKMIFDCDSIGCYSNDPAEGLPLMCRMFLEHEGLMNLLRRERVSVRDFTARLFDPKPTNAIAWSAAARAELPGHLHGLGLESAKIGPGEQPERRFDHIIHVEARAPWSTQPLRAIGLPAMHTPVAELQSLFPDFRIVNLLRDPRDIAVSFFYHLLATLNTGLAMTFVRVNNKTGELEHNPRWRQPFAKRVVRRLQAYFQSESGDASLVHRVRYEDLLTQPVTELQSLLTFLGAQETPAALQQIVKDRSFESATGGKTEQRNSLIRKGQSGDWANYFDRELIDALGKPFIKLVRELGYEDKDDWVDAVPDESPKAFDFARFRIRRSTTRAFIKYWDQSPELQRQYPDSWQDIEGDDCFFTWLESSRHQDVQDWLTLARKLEELWQVDITEVAGR